MPRQIVRNYPDKCAKRGIICTYYYLGKVVAKTSTSSLNRALCHIAGNMLRYGASKVVVSSRAHGDVYITAKLRTTRRAHTFHLVMSR